MSLGAMFTLVASLLLSAAPPPTLGEISAPLGHIGNVVDAAPKGGVSDTDKVVALKWDGCEVPGGEKAVYLMRMLGGAGRVLEQLQQSLDRAPGAEKKLFGRKAVLGEVMKQLSTSKFEPRVSCTAAALVDGFKLEVAGQPRKWCDAKPDATEGEFWFLSGGKPAALISITKGGTEVCKPRISTVLFDAKGAGRVRVHADWGGAMSTTMVGERCQWVEYTLDGERQAFLPVWKSCKR